MTTGGEERVCRNCQRRVTVPPARLATWRACSRNCSDALRRRLKPQNDLQQRILEQIAVRGQTLLEFAREHHLGYGAIRWWFRTPGATTSMVLLTGVAAALGISVEQALAAAGGKTAAERQREVSHEQAALRLTHEVRIKAGKHGGHKGLGKPKSSEHRAAIARSVRALGSRHPNKSTEGRVRSALFRRLVDVEHPERDRLRTWAAEVGRSYKLSASAVLTIWRPYLRPRALWPAGGAPPNEQRCAIVRTLRTTWPRDPRGQAADGFWGEAFKRVRAVEGAKAPDTAEDLRQWWRVHRKHCPGAQQGGE